MSAQGLWKTGLLNSRIQKTENGRIRKGHLRKPRLPPHGCITTPGGEHRNGESGRMCPPAEICEKSPKNKILWGSIHRVLFEKRTAEPVN
jgi:hypothetical protein